MKTNYSVIYASVCILYAPYTYVTLVKIEEINRPRTVGIVRVFNVNI